MLLNELSSIGEEGRQSNLAWDDTLREDDDVFRFVLEDSFLIRGRGWILAPAAPLGVFPHNTALTILVRERNGSTRSIAGTFVVEHLRLSDGGSKWTGVVMLAASELKIPPGSNIRCKKAS